MQDSTNRISGEDFSTEQLFRNVDSILWNCSFEQDNKSKSKSVAAEEILATSQSFAGRKIWAEDRSTIKLTEDGDLGCAMSVRRVLQAAGVPLSSNIFSVVKLRDALKKLGWHEVTQGNLRAGDVVLGYNKSDPHTWSGGNAHATIVASVSENKIEVWNNTRRTTESLAEKELREENRERLIRGEEEIEDDTIAATPKIWDKEPIESALEDYEDRMILRKSD